jgi:Protein of unknown function (DUF2853)
MADLALELADVRRYRPDAAEPVVAGIVKHYGIALANPNADSALVAGKDASELETVREKFLKRKLERTETDEVLDAAIASVLTTMAADTRKRRVTASYLLAEHFGALSVFG